LSNNLGVEKARLANHRFSPYHEDDASARFDRSLYFRQRRGHVEAILYHREESIATVLPVGAYFGSGDSE
jgi:hypothetical protein